MMEKERQYVVFVKDGNPAVAKILEGISSMANVGVSEVKAPTRAHETSTVAGKCGVCGELADPESLDRHPHLPGEVCLLCRSAAENLEVKIQEAAKRHFLDFYDSLPEMVKDMRSGFEAPSFYAGING